MNQFESREEKKRRRKERREETLTEPALLSARPTFSPLSSQKAPQPPPGLRKLRTHTSLTSPKAQSDVGSPRKRHSNPGDNNSKPATQTVALSNGAIFKQGENVAPDLPPRARNSASTEQGHVSRSDWLAIAKQAALLKGVVPERTHTGLLRGTLARDAVRDREKHHR